MNSPKNKPSHIVFKEVAKGRPRNAVYLRGTSRTRENIAQKQLAKMTRHSLQVISQNMKMALEL